MPKKKHTEEQIIAALKQYEGRGESSGHLPEAFCQSGVFLHVEEAVRWTWIQECANCAMRTPG